MFASPRFHLAVVLLLFAAPAAHSAKKPVGEKPRPNVIVIIGDDHGYHDLGVQGAKDIKTPNIDSLAETGVRFTQGYVTCPVCSPSRAALMTGKYQQRFGHEFNPGPQAADNFGLPTDQKTLANYLKEAGYATGAIGKWHLGQRPECRPLQRGFDEYYGFLGGAHSYVPVEQGKASKKTVFRNNEPIDPPPYLTHAFNDEAASFIDRHKDKPFFLYLAYNAIHSPLQAPPGQAEQFADIKDPQRRTMASMLAALDEGVGKILGRLKEHGLENNTLIFYISDNGGPTAGNGSRNDPLSGFKGQTLEGGVRVPMIVRWPAQLPPGKVYDKPVITLDVLPTVVAAIGTSATLDSKIEGVNLLPYLKGDRKGKPHEQLFWRFGPQYAVRSGDWKLVKSRAEAPKLFNLAEDVAEKKDLMASMADKAKELQAAYDTWNAGNMEPQWHDSRQARKAQQPTKTEPGRAGGKKARKKVLRRDQMTTETVDLLDE
ncbi:MAG: sulfatase [Candidatus Sumerlaeaceae bacterium]